VTQHHITEDRNPEEIVCQVRFIKWVHLEPIALECPLRPIVCDAVYTWRWRWCLAHLSWPHASLHICILLCFFLFRSYISYWSFFQDARWNDVNVVSSLLKLFFRRLPDSLLTSELYPHFIEADKIEDPAKRVVAIKKLVMKHRIHDLLMPCWFSRAYVLEQRFYEMISYVLITQKLCFITISLLGKMGNA